jgi:hypothetical protein
MANSLKTAIAGIFAGVSALALSACSTPEVGGQCEITGDGTIAVTNTNSGNKSHEAEIKKDENGTVYAYPTRVFNSGYDRNETITHPNLQIRIERESQECFFDDGGTGEQFRIQGGAPGVDKKSPAPF